MSTLHFIFDGPPGPEGPRFIEVETADGRSINAGEWAKRPDDLWEFVVPRADDLAELRLRLLRSKGRDRGLDYRTKELAAVGLPPEAGWLLAAKDDWHERALRAERALVRPWQPIESAPIDGTVIDLWLDSGRRVPDVHWGEPAEDMPSEFHDPGWLNDDGEYARGEDELPTHWVWPPMAPEETA